ncbi:hypothetical protein [Beijerinckia mobilis]|uniref:hypothetical protein n=1 Tax=Beijerinckia mobilis TaxID=231434 RepID=UPI0012EB337A|nr:hypothetical protein [Beijerinckia mobilis]
MFRFLTRGSIACAALRPITLLVMALFAASLGGCDKCGNKIKINSPTIPESCHDSTSQ